jgi:hypothetical protein
MFDFKDGVVKSASGCLFVLLVITGLATSSCRAIKPYEKEYLVHPVMDDARVERVSAPYGKTKRANERLVIAGAGGGSTSCPTCGGK